MMLLVVIGIIFLMSSLPIGVASAFNQAYTPVTCSNQAVLPTSTLSPFLSKYKCDDCFAGYGDQETKDGSVSGVSDQYTVPQATCGTNSSAVGFLVAIDGSIDFASLGLYQFQPACGKEQTSYLAILYYSGGAKVNSQLGHAYIF
jgi:hypothetical protein